MVKLTIQEFVHSLNKEDLQRLCYRLLGRRGGISLGKSFLIPDSDPSHASGEDVPQWCVCGNCREMDTPRENICCGDRRCVTTFDDFHLLCTNHHVLTVAIHNRADIMADPIDYSPRSYRKAAYRQYILWVHGRLGRGNRRYPLVCRMVH